MDKVKKYIARFLKENEMNTRYALHSDEWRALAEHAVYNIERAATAIVTAFEYGYVKGYRAAVSEMKKGGAL